MRILITGIAGFVGAHLAEHLLAVLPQAQIHGVVHRHDQRIRHLKDRLHLHAGDLRNPLWVSETIAQIQPDPHIAPGGVERRGRQLAAALGDL